MVLVEGEDYHKEKGMPMTIVMGEPAEYFAVATGWLGEPRSQPGTQTTVIKMISFKSGRWLSSSS